MATLAPLEVMFTMRPGGPCLFLSVPKRGAKAWMTTSGEIVLTSNCRLYSLSLRYSSGPLTTIPALFTKPTRFLSPIMEPTFWAASCTASASVMSITRGTKAFPNSFCKRSASACLRTEPNTRNPFETSTFVVPQPIPVETPVTTTSLLFAIAFLLRWITVHLQYLLLLGGHYTKRQKSYAEEFGSSSFEVAKGRRGLLRRRPAACQEY